MKISIIGLGWFGLALANELKSNYQIMGTTRSAEKATKLSQSGLEAYVLNAEQAIKPELLDCDVIVLNIPPFSGQIQWFRSWSINLKTKLIFISSTSVYGQFETLVDEDTVPQPDTENGRILLDAENWVKGFENFTIVRFGGLLGGDRHPGRFLSGRKNLEGGQNPVNLIHLEDAVGFVKLVIENKFHGEIYNLVHPYHPTREEFYTSYCKENRLPLPEFVQSNIGGKKVLTQKVEKIYKFKKNI